MNKLFKLSAIAAVLAAAGTAHADVAETKGGITIKTEDGRFEAKIGGRIHWDMVSLDNDDGANFSDEGGSYFRRARLTLSGKAYGWEYKFENDFADDQPSFRDMFIATKLGGGKLTLGQFKPLRGMEEMTSSNEITMIERPFASASGMFSGRQFAMGAKYEAGSDNFTWGIAAQNNSVLKGSDTRTTEEPVVSGRLTFAPVNSDASTLHLGLSASMEKGRPDAAANGEAQLRGRGKLPATDLGTSRTLATAGSASVGNPAVNIAEEGDAQHIGLEVAGKVGAFYAQAEYIQATYSDAYVDNGAPADADVVAYYVMASYMLTGESKPYKNGVFKSPKPAGANGAWELKARYDLAENKDQPTSATNEREISVLTVGANWYLNPNMRFMLEYSMGEDRTTLINGESVEPTAVTLRTQFSF
jgi:phosphate-selective porin OprO and OprP